MGNENGASVTTRVLELLIREPLTNTHLGDNVVETRTLKKEESCLVLSYIDDFTLS